MYTRIRIYIYTYMHTTVLHVITMTLIIDRKVSRIIQSLQISYELHRHKRKVNSEIK